MNEPGDARDYLEALARELRVGRGYRRRALAEIAGHIDDIVEQERRRGTSTEEAERVAVRRLGSVSVVARELCTSRRETLAQCRERRRTTLAILGAAVVVACATFAKLATGKPDDHLGLEAVAAISSAIALFACGSRVLSQRTRPVLAAVAGVWIGTSAVLAGDGDLVYCGLVAGLVAASAAAVVWTRRLGWRLRGGAR